MIDLMTRAFKRVGPVMVAVIGASILLLGIVMVALPGPGLLVIMAGLAVLATKFEWARSALGKVRNAIGTLKKDR